MAAYENRYWSSADGVRLHARDYPGEQHAPPLLCLPGRTRNARDYEALAIRLEGRRRVIAMNLRGRGESGHAKDPTTYTTTTYVEDVRAGLETLGVEQVVTVGTSLGGVVAMLLAHAAPGLVVAALLNDIGPEVEAAGIGRIRGAVGRAGSYPTWMHAARAVGETYAEVYPDWRIEEWLAMAKRLYRLTGTGRVVLDYDQRIAEPFRGESRTESAGLLWEALAALRTVPVLVVRGERSDVLSAAVAGRMIATLDRAELVTVPGVGHSPTLGEPAAVAGLEQLLARTE